MLGEKHFTVSIKYATNYYQSMLEGRNDMSSARKIGQDMGQCQCTCTNRTLHLAVGGANVHFGRSGIELLDRCLFCKVNIYST